MPLRIDEAITQLDHGWLDHLRAQGYGGDALRQAVELALYAQQQAAARNSSEFKAAIYFSFRAEADSSFTAGQHGMSQCFSAARAPGCCRIGNSTD